MYDHQALRDRIQDCVVQTVYDAIRYIGRTTELQKYIDDVCVFGLNIQAYMMDRLEELGFDFDRFSKYMQAYDEWAKELVQKSPPKPDEKCEDSRWIEYEDECYGLYIEKVAELQQSLKELEYKDA